MNSLETLLQQISDLFHKQKYAWALVGGLAVSIRTEPRFTRDLDLAVAVSNDSEAESLVHGLIADGLQAVATVEHEKTKRLATARIAPSGASPNGLVLDLLFASSGIEAEICRDAEKLLVFPDVSVPVARIHHLIALKLLSRDDKTRPQDGADLRQLVMNADDTDFELTREDLNLIKQRGYNRDRDLASLLDETWRTFRQK